ncbi:M48 family metalloprotease [Streptomyces sp. NPDC049577]|uniref:M48 family metalloprotease n=1 Tax=Streptomyces sp. NPDC049577 TaxID=3155153 RepID=UPI003424A59B
MRRTPVRRALLRMSAARRLPLTGGGIPDTGLRFALLMTLVTAASVSMLDTTLAPRPDDTPGDALGCLLAAGLDPDGSNLANLLAGVRSPEAIHDCLSGAPAVAYGKGMAATALLLAVAALVYWWLPRLRERRHATLPLEAVDPDGMLARELAELRAIAGTGDRVRFRVAPGRTTAGAVVHGRAGRYTVSLHAGLLVLYGVDRDRFRAVVLHELAHLRHRDVDFAYSSTALWRTFVALALLPYLYHEGDLLLRGLLGRTRSPFWPGVASITTYSLLSGLLLVLLVHLTRADLLRRRELYADAQAIAWGASPSAWDRPDRTAGRWRRATALLRTHPDWAERRRALAEPGRLAPVSALPMLLLGIAGSFLVHQLTVFPGLSETAATPWIAACFVTPVLCHLLRRSREAGVRAGLWLGLGLLAGEFVVGGNSGNEWLVGQPAYLLTFLLAGWVPTVWCAQSARLEACLPGRWARRAVVLLNGLVTLALLWGGLRWWQQWGKYQAVGVYDRSGALRTVFRETFPGPWRDYAFELSAATEAFPGLHSFNNSVPLGLAVMASALVPLFVHLRAGRTGLRVRRTLLAGGAGGLLCWLGLAAGSYALHAERPGTLRGRFGAFQYVQIWWLVVTVTGACLVTGAVVAGVSRRYWLLRALLAAQLAEVIGFAGVYLLSSADGCLGPLNVIGSSCHWLPANGRTLTALVAAQSLTSAVLCAAAAALAGAAVARVVRRFPAAARPAAEVPSARPRPALLRQTAGLALALPALLLAVVTYTYAPGPRASSAVGKPPTTSPAMGRLLELLDAPRTARTATIRQWQALAWLNKGGLRHVAGLSRGYLALTSAIGKAAAQEPTAQGTIEIDESEFARLCGTLGSRVRDARRYFPFPDPALDRRWSKTLDRIARDSEDCLSGTTGGKDGAERERAFARFLTNSPETVHALLFTMQDMEKQSEAPS